MGMLVSRLRLPEMEGLNELANWEEVLSLGLLLRPYTHRDLQKLGVIGTPGSA